MALERTLSIIKPDAVAKNVIGEIYSRFEKAGLKVVAAKMKHLSKQEAEGFYAVHRERPFFGALVDYAEEGNQLWTCPGHNGGVFYSRSPIGRVFMEHLGEAVFRDDLDIEAVRERAGVGRSRTAGQRRDFERYRRRVVAPDVAEAAARLFLTIKLAVAGIGQIDGDIRLLPTRRFACT